MGLLSGGMESLSLSGKSGRRSSDASGRGERPEGNENDTSELDKEEGNILGSIISQCESRDTDTFVKRRLMQCSTAWDGFEQNRATNVRPGATVVVGEDYRFLLPSRPYLWVSHLKRTRLIS
jgi:hypothetical protein